MGMTVTGGGTFFANNTFLQTNGCEHSAISVDYFVFSNSEYYHNAKKVTMTTIIANVY